ncbi:MAG: hypothetical protein HWN68_01405 [Desulfobacterales bacterium]|nr:hypothetical protein [Desulfobacterales bacterium]
MSPISWKLEDLEELYEKISYLDKFLTRNHFTLIYDTNPEDSVRQELLKTIKNLHEITGRMISIEDQRG